MERVQFVGLVLVLLGRALTLCLQRCEERKTRGATISIRTIPGIGTAYLQLVC